MEDEGLDFNFWPSFADMMLSVVLALVLVMFVFVSVKAIGTIDLSNVQQRQLDVVEAVARSYGKRAAERPPEERKETKGQVRVFCIPLTKPDSCEISVRNEAELQRITFSDHVLFEQNEYELNEQGREALRRVTEALKADGRLDTIKEIQIQGHADNTRKKDAPEMYNVRLAADRAMSVYEYLMSTAGIDPARYLMSATSFGEFSPVGRARVEGRYDRARLEADNQGDERQRLNRRIELLLFY